MNSADSNIDYWPSHGAKRVLSTVLIGAAALSLSVATGCSAQEPAKKGPPGTPQAATPETFWARVQAAGPGDVVQLGEGEYGNIKFYKKKVAEPGFRIEAKPGAKVVFNGITFEDSEGISVEGAEIAIAANPYGVDVEGSSRIKLSGLKIHALAGTPSSAMMLRDFQDLVVSDCDVSAVGTGINFLESHDIKVTGNHFHDLQIDAIRGTASRVEVIGNTATSFHPDEGDHPDFIQFWGSKTGVATGNVIKDNVFERGRGPVVQGIFIEDNQNLIISGNAMVGTMYNGISLSGVKGALVENNFVQGYKDMGTRIITRGASSNVIVRNNVSEAIVTLEDQGQPNPGYKEEHNSSIGAAKIGDTSAMQAWIAKRKAP